MQLVFLEQQPTRWDIMLAGNVSANLRGVPFTSGGRGDGDYKLANSQLHFEWIVDTFKDTWEYFQLYLSIT